MTGHPPQAPIFYCAADAHTRAQGAAHHLAATVGRHVATGAHQVHEAQRALGVELKSTRQAASGLVQASARLAGAVERAEAAALQFGDVENFIAAIEAEIGSIAAALRHVQQAEAARRGQQQQQQQQARS